MIAAARTALLRGAAWLWPRRISVMMRVRNEEEFLAAAVGSIIDAVDEVVIVDNASSDATPAVIEALREAHPRKVVAHRYPHAIARVGAETWRLHATSGGASPHLSGVYYNWCLHRCTRPYVLKWDGDMLATSTVHRALEAWRRGGPPLLLMHGANVHPDGLHLAAARSSDHAALVARQGAPSIPRWVGVMTYDHPEPHLFPRFGARYDHRAGFTQSLASPFLEPRVRATMRAEEAGVSYLHLKLLKRDPYANYSVDLARVIAGNLAVGPRLDVDSRRLLERWGVRSADERRA